MNFSLRLRHRLLAVRFIPAAGFVLLAALSTGKARAEFLPTDLGNYNGPVDAGKSYSPVQLNNLDPGTTTDMRNYAYTDNYPEDLYYNSQEGTGALSDSHNFGSSSSGFGSVSGGDVTASDVQGALHGYSFASASIPPVDEGMSGDQATAQTTATISGSVTLLIPATVTLYGTLEGSLQTNNASAAVNMTLLLLNPNTDENGNVSAYGGYQIEIAAETLGSSSGIVEPFGPSMPPQYPFSVNIDLPAGTTFFYGSLYTQAIAEVGIGDPLGGSAVADFGHTLNFGLTVPPDALSPTPDSSQSLLPINVMTSSAPEPGSLALFLPAILYGGACAARRRRSRSRI